MALLVAWAGVLLASMPFASRQLDNLTNGGFEVDASQSAEVERTLHERYSERAGERMALVLQWRDAKLAGRGYWGAIARAEAALDDGKLAIDPAVAEIVASLEPEDGRKIVPLQVHATVREAIDSASRVRADLHMDEAQSGPISMQLVGRPAQVAAVHEAAERGARSAEAIGFPLVLLILLVVFGSFAAAALPVLIGVVSVIVTGALIYLVSEQFAMSVFVVNVASMIGIGVAVDYSLFMLARYREEIAAGRSEGEAREAMLTTSGQAVVFAGGTVVVSLATVFLIDNTILRSIAFGAMLVVTVAVLVAVTAMPALVAALGQRLHGTSPRIAAIGAALRRLPGVRGRGEPAEPFWQRWTGRVMARPVLSIVGVTGLLLLMAAPLLSVELGVDTVRQLSPDDPSREAVEAVKESRGPGEAAPVVVIAKSRDSVRGEHVGEAIRSVLSRDPDLSPVSAPWTTAGGRTVRVAGTPRHDPESEAGQDQVRRLREQLADVGPVAAGWTISVGGTAATIVDASDQVSDNLWKIVLAVLVLSFALLLGLLRSVFLPVKAIVMNLLTVGAASGVLVVVFQWGWLEGLGIESLGHLEIYVPPLIFAVVYGLSMDYEIFLLTRIRERYRETGDNRVAVLEGVASSARTVSSAALVMVVVFSVFVATNVPIIQEIGLGTAVAIAIDATLTRLVLLPATMTLLGDLNWWAPGALGHGLARAGRATQSA
jgi:uncharacterized membrane protein YdfJ with MMPL/SSD domain